VTLDPAKAFRLDGKAALITGGTRGIGRAIAEAYLAAGAGVCVMARKPDELAETQEALGAQGGSVTTFEGSAGDPAAIEACVAHCVDELGGVDVLVNNAGTNPTFEPLVDIESRAVRKVLEVNLEGPLLLVQHSWRAWMQEHGGVVINVASVGGIRPSIGLGIYNASKAALIHMTRQLAMEMGPTVRVNCLAPGLVKTFFARALYEHGEDAIASRFPMKRLGVPDDMAGAALFLASDASAWLTGEVLVVDGGQSVSSPG
jgi:NAD(P)-dependent dehydrogenase (short-subunit alcohol dehydrogenase family)